MDRFTLVSSLLTVLATGIAIFSSVSGSVSWTAVGLQLDFAIACFAAARTLAQYVYDCRHGKQIRKSKRGNRHRQHR